MATDDEVALERERAKLESLMKYIKNTIWIQMGPPLILLFAIQAIEGAVLLSYLLSR